MNIAKPVDRFLTLAGAAVADVASRATTSRAAQAAGLRVAALLATPPEPTEPLPPHRLPVCDRLNAAYATMRPDLVTAFKALEPELAWQKRTLPNGSPDFAAGHASARVLDRTGLEQRGGLISGISLVAPGVTYPEHDHPPEEIYLVLSGGEWWQAGGAWHAPGPGGIVHNPPGIRHAMRGTDVPLLAIWFLLPG